MKYKTSAPAIVSASVGITLFTTLLLIGKLDALAYTALVSLTAIAGLAIFLSSRLSELDLKNLRLVLREIEQVKAEIEEMYGGIEKIKRAPLVLDEEKGRALGLELGTVALGGAVMRYTAGVMKRERERLAQIFITGRSGEKIAEALLDGSKDDLVFKWNGPETPLETPPKSISQREAEAATKSSMTETK